MSRDDAHVRPPAAPSPPEGAAAPERAPASAILGLWRGSRPADVRTLLERHPDLAADPEQLCELAYEEYCQRLEAGEAPDPDEFSARFPPCRVALRKMIESLSFVEAHGDVWEYDEPTPWPAPGEVFLGFELVRELGRGSFSRVFLAREPALGRRWVALKVSQLGDTEAAILGRVPHPNIVPVHSAGVDAGSGLAAVCMPYLGRATLADVCDRVAGRPALPRRARFVLDAVRAAAPPGGEEEPAPPDPALRRGDYVAGVLHLGAQIADALAFVHARGVYHRDLKPSNVLLTPGGRPMLLDFNLSFDEHVRGGWLGGTLSYMPPEQLHATAPGGRGAAGVDARSDLYALGVILYLLLAGRHPSGPLPRDDEPAAEQRAELLRRQAAGPAPLRQANPDLDPAVAGLVERCLAFDPAARPQGAAEVARALRQARSPWRRARRRLAGRAPFAVALAAAAGLAVAGVAVREADRGAALPAGLEAARRHDDRQAVRLLGRALEADPHSEAAHLARAHAYWRLGEFGLALPDFERADSPDTTGRDCACRGYCLNQIGRPDLAIEQYKRAIGAGFATKEVYNNLGCSYARTPGRDAGRDDLARAAFTEAIRLDGWCQAALYNVARLEFTDAQNGQDDRIDVGIDHIERAVRAGPAPNLRLVAAALYAQAYGRAVRKKADPAEQAAWAGKAFRCLEDGLDRGLDPVEMARYMALTPLPQNAETRGRLESLAHRRAVPHPVPSVLPLLNPCPDLRD